MQSDFDQEINDIFDNELELKPITEGLGFHHSSQTEKKVRTSLNNQALELKDSLQHRAQVLNTTVQTENSKDMGELAPFYAKEEKANIPQVDLATESSEEKLKQEDTIVVENKLIFKRAGAFFTDVFLLLLTSFITFTLMLLAAKLPLSFGREVLADLDFIILLAPLFCMFYVFYFSFFDRTNFSTPGKKLFSLKVIGLNGRNASFLRCLSRSVITLVSLFSLGLFSYIDLQGKFTDTKVCEQ